MGDMTYASAQHLQQRYGEAELRQTTDDYGQQIDLGRVQTALDDASAEIDTFLTGRYQLPLVDLAGAALPEPPVLTRCACDIAIYRLQTLRAADDIKDARRRYEDVLGLLKRIKAGEVELAGAQLVPVLEGGVGGGAVEFNIPPEPPYSPFARSER
jgi:phage gp36-like protein